jgi:hypothetical protein
MILSSNVGPWAVYQTTIRGKPTLMRVICEQSEWDKMEKGQPNGHSLIRGWIQSEAEAERLAREAPPSDEKKVDDATLRMRR